MGYTAVRGGLEAIEHAESLVQGMPTTSNNPLKLSQLMQHLAIATDRVMSEGGLVDSELASLAIKQAEGDLIEAAFLIRAYRSTLPRLGYTLTVTGRDVIVSRRISSIFRDIPGGQLLGLTRDYTQRLLDFGLIDAPGRDMCVGEGNAAPSAPEFPVVIDFLREEGMLPEAPPLVSSDEPFDVTRTPVRFPMVRSGVLQILARGEAGGMLMLAYSSMRGYGGVGHGAVAELRGGELPVRISHPITGR